MKCQIQWIDPNTGEPTPDANDAVAIACAHEGIWEVPSGSPDNRIVGYGKVARIFPICQRHLDMATPDIERSWTFIPLPTEPKGMIEQ